MKLFVGVVLAAALALGVILVPVGSGDPVAEASPIPATQEREREILVPGGQTFSRMVRGGDFLFLSGILGRSRQEENGIGPETQRALDTIEGLLEQAGADKQDLVKCTVFLADIGDYGAMNEVYGAFFEGTPPARTALQIAALPVEGAAVEIECMAYAPAG